MRVLETTLFVVAFVSELTAAALVMFEIRENRDLRSRTLGQPSSLAAALDPVSGILTVFDKQRIELQERVASEERAKKLKNAILRQSWAFVMLVFGAMAAVAASLLTVWVH